MLDLDLAFQVEKSVAITDVNSHEEKAITKHGNGKGPLKIDGSSTKIQKKNDKCHFCRKCGHFQKDCVKCKALKKKVSTMLYILNQT